MKVPEAAGECEDRADLMVKNRIKVVESKFTFVGVEGSKRGDDKVEEEELVVPTLQLGEDNVEIGVVAEEPSRGVMVTAVAGGEDEEPKRGVTPTEKEDAGGEVTRDTGLGLMRGGSGETEAVDVETPKIFS